MFAGSTLPWSDEQHGRFNGSGFNHGLKQGQRLTKIFKEFDGKFLVTRASRQARRRWPHAAYI
jgi:hypothetical protein